MTRAQKKQLPYTLLPFLRWLPELRNRTVLKADLVAGLTVALVLIPQSMAYAQLAGLPPYYGLYAAFLPPMLAALFGSSRQLATGPVAVVSLMTAAALEPVAASGSQGYITYAILLAFMVGVFQFALGVLRMGILVNFLSHPVVLGFTNAAAIIIATSQLPKIFGVTVEKADYQYQTVWRVILTAIEHIHWPTFFMAVLAFGIMIGFKRLSPRAPGVIIAVAITTILSWAFEFQKQKTVNPEQIESPTVRSLIEKQIQLQATGARLNEKLNIARDKLVKTKAEYGEENSRTLLALEAADALEVQTKTLAENLRTGARELDSLRFISVLAGNGDQSDRFYLQDEAPEGSAAEELWRIEAFTENHIELHAGGQVVGTIPQALPSFALPQFDTQRILEFLTTAIFISLIGFVEAISIAKAMAVRTRQRLDPNQELIGQGISNVVGSMFGSYAVSGSFSRSAVNISAGAQTGFSSVVTSIVVAVTLLFLTPLLYDLPRATLAAVIMMAVIGLINVKPILYAWKLHVHDGLAAVTTFVLTLVLAPHVETGIVVGVILALALFVYRTMKPRVAELAMYTDGTYRDVDVNQLDICDEISLLRWDGSLYFANVSYFEEQIFERLGNRPNLKYIIVDAEGINQLDATGEGLIRNIFDQLKESGIKVFFARSKKQILDTLRRTGAMDEIGEQHFFPRVQQAIDKAWEELGSDHARTCPLSRDYKKATS